jgi:predicted metallopeptidase
MPIKKNHPLIMRWADELPSRSIRATSRHRSPAWFDAHANDHSGRQQNEPFDFGAAITHLVDDIALRMDDFRHVQTAKVLVSVVQARLGSQHGLQARVTPLRFAGGTLTRQRRGVPYRIQRYFRGEQEFLYVLTFCLPRYLDLDFDHKMVTLFHELYHIGPAFDGDLRRHHGRCQFHTHSQRKYDERMVQYAREYLAGRPDANLHAFLRLNFAQLQERHGSVIGVVVPRPKIIPLIGPYALAAAQS